MKKIILLACAMALALNAASLAAQTVGKTVHTIECSQTEKMTENGECVPLLPAAKVFQLNNNL